MIEKRPAVFGHSIPKDLATLLRGWKDVPIDTDALDNLCDREVEQEQILTGAAMPYKSCALRAACERPPRADLIRPRLPTMRKFDLRKT